MDSTKINQERLSKLLEIWGNKEIEIPNLNGFVKIIDILERMLKISQKLIQRKIESLRQAQIVKL